MANLVQRLVFLLVPLAAILIPLVRLLPEAIERRQKSGLYRRYGELKFLELEQPDAVGKLIGELACYLHREAGLADPAHPGQRDQPMGS